MFRRPTIYLVDDHSGFCEAAAKSLRNGFEMAGYAHDAHTAATNVARVRPDLVVIDVCMQMLNAIDAVKEIHDTSPVTRLLFVAQNGETTRPVNLGPFGFLVKIVDFSELPNAIWSVLSDRQTDDEFQPSQLTRREREVVQLLAEGKLMKQVADLLNVSPRTVAFHKYGVMRKLGLHSSAELVRMAVTEGLIASATPGSLYESIPHSSGRSASS